MKASTIISLAFFAIVSAIPAPSSDLLVSSPANLIDARPQLVRRKHSGGSKSKSGKEEEENHDDEIDPIIPDLSKCHHGVYGFNCRQMVTLHILLNGNEGDHHEEEHDHDLHVYDGELDIANCHPGEYGFNCVMMIQLHYLIHNEGDHHDE
jgi:hypothetical protein